MATNYPNSLDALTNPTSTDKVDTVDHAAQHANANDAIEALETKLGTGASTATANTVLRGTGAGTTAFGQIVIEDIDDTDLAGLDGTLLTGTAGTGGNFPQWNADGDLVDSSKAVPTGAVVGTTDTQTLTNKTINSASNTLTINSSEATLTINADEATISELETDNFKTNIIDTDTNLTADSDLRLATQKAVKAYVDNNTGTEFQKTFPTRAEFDGATLPVPLYVQPDGTLNIGDANDGECAKFIGFCTTQTTNILPEYLNGTSSNTTTTSVTANAGTDRVLIVTVGVSEDSGIASPTGVTWDGNAMTKVHDIINGSVGVSVWYYALGDSVSNQTADVVVSGQTTDGIDVLAAVYQYVDQSTQVDASAENSGSSTTPSATIDPDIAPSLAVGSFVWKSFSDRSGGMTQRQSQTHTFQDGGTSRCNTSLCDSSYKKLASSGFSITLSGSVGWAAIVFNLRGLTTNVDITYGGSVGGFSGLTPNATYYLQDTEGTIGTSAGSTEVKVGKALDTDELFVQHS